MSGSGSPRASGDAGFLIMKDMLILLSRVKTDRRKAYFYLITTQAKRNLSSRSGIGGVRSAT